MTFKVRKEHSISSLTGNPTLDDLENFIKNVRKLGAPGDLLPTVRSIPGDRPWDSGSWRISFSWEESQ